MRHLEITSEVLTAQLNRPLLIESSFHTTSKPASSTSHTSYRSQFDLHHTNTSSSQMPAQSPPHPLTLPSLIYLLLLHVIPSVLCDPSLLQRSSSSSISPSLVSHDSSLLITLLSTALVSTSYPVASSLSLCLHITLLLSSFPILIELLP